MDFQEYSADPIAYTKKIKTALKEWSTRRKTSVTKDIYDTTLKELCVSDNYEDICKMYVSYLMKGESHKFTEDLLKMHSFPTYSNVCIPLLHHWNSDITIEPLVMISHPDDVERICQTHITKAPVFTKFLYNSLISTTDNDEWKQQRDEMNMAFIPSLSLKRVFPISMKQASQCVFHLRELSSNGTRSVNMSEFFLYETLAQLQVSMFGFSEEFQNTTNSKIRQAFTGENIDYLNTYVPLALDKLQDAKGPLHKYFGKMKDDLQDYGNLLIFTFAGHDTTGHTLTWLLYELCSHPEYQQTLIQEIDTYWSNHETPTYDSFKELPFMTRCITEILRLWPALANGTWRQLETDETIHDLNGKPICVPKGTYCQIMNWSRHRNKELWGDDVNVFNPYRKYEDSEIWAHEGFATYNVSSSRYSPFTYGPRNCIGKNFSHMEMRLILLYIFKNYTFSLTKEQAQAVKDDNFGGFNIFTMGPKSIYPNEVYGMQLNVINRYSRL